MRDLPGALGRLHPHDDRAVPLPADLRPRQRRGLRPRPRSPQPRPPRGADPWTSGSPRCCGSSRTRSTSSGSTCARTASTAWRCSTGRAWPTWWGRTCRSRWTRRRSSVVVERTIAGNDVAEASCPARSTLPRGVQAIVAVGGGVAVDVGEVRGVPDPAAGDRGPDGGVQRRLLLARGEPDGRRPTGELPGDDPVRRRHRHRGRGRVARPVHLLRHRRPAVEVQRDRRLEAGLPPDRRADQRLRRDDLPAERAEPRQPLRASRSTTSGSCSSCAVRW